MTTKLDTVLDGMTQRMVVAEQRVKRLEEILARIGGLMAPDGERMDVVYTMVLGVLGEVPKPLVPVDAPDADDDI